MMIYTVNSMKSLSNNLFSCSIKSAGSMTLVMHVLIIHFYDPTAFGYSPNHKETTVGDTKFVSSKLPFLLNKNFSQKEWTNLQQVSFDAFYNQSSSPYRCQDPLRSPWATLLARVGHDGSGNQDRGVSLNLQWNVTKRI